MTTFQFAGFTFPKKVWMLPRGSLSKRVAEAREPRVCGPYMHAPKPEYAGRGAFFYLGSDFQIGRSWQWADEACRHGINHRGWYTNDYCDDTIRGIVIRLPHKRFLAGWSMGEGMASEVDGKAFDDIIEAAMYADECARVAAGRQREHEDEQRRADEAAEQDELLATEEHF